MQQSADGVWLPITEDVFQCNSYTTYKNGVITISKGSTGWKNAAKFNSLLYTFAQLEGKTIHVAFDYTISGTVGNNRGIVFSISEWPSQSTASLNDWSQRKSFVSLPDCKDASGHFEWTEELSIDTFTGGTNLHSPNNYIGGIIYLMAATNVSCTISNIKYEYLS